MAAARSVGNSRHLVTLIISCLSNMTYMVRYQRGPDQPVECHEFRPTLVPALLVNKDWADIVTSILWKRYPHLPALADIAPERRQWYADKVERLLVVGQSYGDPSDLAYLQGIRWSKLKTLEVMADWKTYEVLFTSFNTSSGILEHVELFGPQARGSRDFEDLLRGSSFILLVSEKARHLRFGPDVTDPEDPVDGSLLLQALKQNKEMQELGIMNFSCSGKYELMKYLCHRKGLQTLEIDLDPGLELLPLFSGPDALRYPFAYLLRLDLMCYPEIALALIPQLLRIRHVQLTIGRLQDHEAATSDPEIINKLVHMLALLPELRMVKIHVGQLSQDFPSPTAHPALSGVVLADLASGCPLLRELTLSTVEPAAIDGTSITVDKFEQFCKHASNLQLLSLKFLPSTAIALESSALQCLGTHCPKLEVLRLKSALHLPSLAPSNEAGHTENDVSRGNAQDANEPQSPPAIMLNGKTCIDYANLEASIPSSHQPFFKNLTHLAIARPHTILSIANETSSPHIDPFIREQLVGSWAQNLLGNFPRLEILEAWGDWRGTDNESLNYFLPREEILATTWEFLSGVEQDLWDYNEDVEDIGVEAEYPSRNRSDGEDWKRASLVNEYPESYSS